MTQKLSKTTRPREFFYNNVKAPQESILRGFCYYQQASLKAINIISLLASPS